MILHPAIPSMLCPACSTALLLYPEHLGPVAIQLYNKMSADQQKEWILSAGEKRITISFYTYERILNPRFLRDKLFLDWNPLHVLGRIYIATEGVNAQLSVPSEHMEAFKSTLDSIDFLNGIRLNVAIEQDDLSFLKLTIKVRPKIVADGLKDWEADPNKGGVHLDAVEFNEIISSQDTILIDMRNHYESEVGHFEGAVLPDVDTFRESLPRLVDEFSSQKDEKNIVMYCTGGIRCEKASAYFKNNGYQKVYQLNGGVIEYVRQIKQQGVENKFHGKNFVFDARMAERVSDEVISTCHQCGAPCDTHVNCANIACNLLFIQCDECGAKMESTCSDACLAVTHLPEEEQVRLRKGKKAKKRSFSKGRAAHLLQKETISQSTA